jgi:hypothetical protein
MERKASELATRSRKLIVGVSIGCIIIASLMAIGTIWQAVSQDVLWRSLATLGVVFMACIMCTGVLNYVQEIGKSAADERYAET